MQGKKLAFPCFSFAESGLFKGLRRIQIKNPFCRQLAFPVVSETSQTHSGAPLPAAWPGGGARGRRLRTYNTDGCFGKAIADFFVFRNPV
jgi:hypothetical protein